MRSYLLTLMCKAELTSPCLARRKDGGIVSYCNELQRRQVRAGACIERCSVLTLWVNANPAKISNAYKWLATALSGQLPFLGLLVGACQRAAKGPDRCLCGGAWDFAQWLVCNRLWKRIVGPETRPIGVHSPWRMDVVPSRRRLAGSTYRR